MRKLKTYVLENVHVFKIGSWVLSRVWGKLVARGLKNKKVFMVAFLLMLLFATYGDRFFPKVSAATITVSIEPDRGHVGDAVRVVGEVETSNGTYAIFFGDEQVKSGVASDKVVNDTFVVPHRPRGEYVVRLHDTAADTSASQTFSLETGYHIGALVPPSPEQFQEGAQVKIQVNVTGGEKSVIYHANVTVVDPSGAAYYDDTLSLSVDSQGDAQSTTVYPADFLPALQAHTNYTGWYGVYLNKTGSQFLSFDSLFIGLTNATEYHKFQAVNVKAAGYTQPNERAWVNITLGEQVVFSQSVEPVGGLVETGWTIPENATLGNYTVTVISSTTPSTIKPVPDVQNFTISEAFLLCRVQALNLNDEPVAGIIVDAYRKVDGETEKVRGNATDAEGWTTLLLKPGFYDLKALWGNEPDLLEVGVLSGFGVVENNTKETLRSNLTNVRIIAEDAKGLPFPFIEETITYNYTTTGNKTVSKQRSFLTNETGVWALDSMPINMSYTIEARRYGLSFFNQTLEKLPLEPFFTLTITCPVYTLFVKTLDSSELPAQNIRVAMYEWSGKVLVDSKTTDAQGNAVFSATFGRYRVMTYSDDILLNETIVDLIEDRLSLSIHYQVLNIDVSVVVDDYFGTPIPNALVKLEREKTGLDYEVVANSTTGLDGAASFDNIIGGYSRLSVYVAGQLAETRSLYLDASKKVVFKIDGYVVVGGYPLETGQLITGISLALLVALFILTLMHRRLSRVFLRALSSLRVLRLTLLPLFPALFGGGA